MQLHRIPGLVLLLGLLPAVAFGQQHARRGTLLGGVTGAIAGAAIGNENDEAAAGAAIGAALGAITGGLIGESVDQQEARLRYVQQQRLRQQARAVSVLDVLTMKQNGLSDAVVINHIRENGVRERLGVADVIALHRQGLSDAVITALQQASAPTYAPLPPPAAYRAPLIVEEHHYVAPPVVGWPYCPPRYYHHPHVHHHGPAVSWGVFIGH